MRCPSFERLLDYLDGQLAADEATRIQAHLATECARCAANRQWYLQVRALAAADDAKAPPAWVTKRALRIFDRHRPRFVEKVKEAVAALVFDSFTRPALAGVRSTATSSRQLLYRADDYHIDLQLVPTDQQHLEVIGQILSAEEANFVSVAGLKVALQLGEQAVYQTSTNDLGEFVIRGVEQGEYDLRVETEETSLTAYAIPVTAAN